MNAPNSIRTPKASMCRWVICLTVCQKICTISQKDHRSTQYLDNQNSHKTYIISSTKKKRLIMNEIPDKGSIGIGIL